MLTPYSRILASILVVFALMPRLLAQDETPTRVTEQNRSGDLPFSGFVGTDLERVQIANGNLVVNIPVESVPGRAGMAFKFGIWYDNRFWTAATRSGVGASFQFWNLEKRFYLAAQNSLHGLWSATQHGLMETSYQKDCGPRINGPSGQVMGTRSVIYIDSSGGKHGIEAGDESGQCFNPDGSWTFVNSGPDTTGIGAFGTEQGVTLADGTSLSAGGLPLSPNDPPGPGPITAAQPISTQTDSNGNFQGEFPSGMDTLGRNLLTQTQSTTTVQYSFQDSNGNPQSYTVGFQPVTIATNFNVIGSLGRVISEASGTRIVETSLALPNGRSYAFTYDNYGSLKSILLPTGGEIDYTYQNFPCGDSTYRYVATRTVTVNGQQSIWTFNQTYTGGGSCKLGATAFCTPQGGVLTTDNCTPPVTVTVTDPLNNQSVYTVLEGNVTSAKIYQGVASGTPLHQYAITYTDYNYPSSSGATPSLWLPTKIVTQLQNGQTDEKDFQYDTLGYPMTVCPDPNTCASFGTTTITKNTSRGNVTDIWEYDWGAPGSGTHGALLRRTHKDYALNTNTNYLAQNIVNKVTQVSVYDSTANTCQGQSQPCSQTQYEYDNYVAGDNPLQPPTNSAPQHDPGHGGTFTFRGNATRVKHWRNTDGALLTTTYSYDDLGNIRAVKDPLGNTTSYDYTDSFANGGCAPPSGTLAQAYVSTVTNAFGQQIKVVRFPCTGLVQAHKDQNDINAGKDGTTYTRDLINRVTSTVLPDAGETDVCYSDVAGSSCYNGGIPLKVVTTKKITASTNLVTTTVSDGLGRTTQAQLNSNPQGVAYTDTTYDLMGRVASVSNPYFSASDPTYGITQTTYDALGRVAQVTKQDGSASTVTYNLAASSLAGDCMQTVDESGRQKISCSDALGRLTGVAEPPASSQPLPSVVPVTIGGFLQGFQSSAPPAAAPGSGLPGFVDSAGGQHWAYLSSNQHLYNLFWNASRGYGYDDVTSAANGPAAQGMSLTGFFSGSQQWSYFDSNAHVGNFWWNGAYGYQDATSGAGAPAAAPGSAIAGFADSSGGQHWAYLGSNQHLYQVSWTAGSYTYADITSSAGSIRQRGGRFCRYMGRRALGLPGNQRPCLQPLLEFGAIRIWGRHIRRGRPCVGIRQRRGRFCRSQWRPALGLSRWQPARLQLLVDQQ